MGIIKDTAKKMNVTEHMVFEMWGCFERDVSTKQVDEAYNLFYYEGKINARIQSFCIDILSGRIPLITLPLKAKKNGEK